MIHYFLKAVQMSKWCKIKGPSLKNHVNAYIYLTFLDFNRRFLFVILPLRLLDWFYFFLQRCRSGRLWFRSFLFRFRVRFPGRVEMEGFGGASRVQQTLGGLEVGESQTGAAFTPPLSHIRNSALVKGRFIN